MAITIRDVARTAGVSTATVSYVLNDRKGAVKISEETRARIWNAVKELGYHPNALARSLAGKRTHTVALVMQYASIFSSWSGFTSEMMHGVVQAAVHHDLDLMLHTRERPDTQTEAMVLTDGRVDGALLLRDWDDPLIDLLVEHQIPTTLIFGRSRNPCVPYACCDDELGGRMATEHLIALGHRRIMHLGGPEGSSAAVDRRAGFVSVLREHGIEPNPAWILQVTHSGAPFDEALAALHDTPRPTAVFAWSDDVALRLMAEARNARIRVPDDLSVVGFDSTEICNHTSPTLTSVSQNIPLVASEGVRLLAERIRNRKGEITRFTAAPELHVRESSGPAPSR